MHDRRTGLGDERAFTSSSAPAARPLQLDLDLLLVALALILELDAERGEDAVRLPSMMTQLLIVNPFGQTTAALPQLSVFACERGGLLPQPKASVLGLFRRGR